MMKKKSLLNYCGLLGVAAFCHIQQRLYFHRSHMDSIKKGKSNVYCVI